MSERFTYFFFIPEKGVWKIGRSHFLEQRQRQVWYLGREGRIVAAFPEVKFPELFCHELFQAKRLNGEWFADCDEIRVFLERNKEHGIVAPDTYIPKPRGIEKITAIRKAPRASGKTQTSITLSKDLVTHAREVANQDGRSLSNWLELFIRRKCSSDTSPA